MLRSSRLLVAIALFATVLRGHADKILDKFLICLTDSRGGTYANYKDISCKRAAADNGNLEVYCTWSGGGIVGVNYVLPANTSVIKEAETTSYCRDARRLEVFNYQEHFIMDLDVSTGLPRLPGAPLKYLKWRQWIQWVSPVRVTLINGMDSLPSMVEFTGLRSFSLHSSQAWLPKGNDTTLLLPELPSSIEEISLARNELTYIPHTGNNSLPLLRRLDMSHNSLQGIMIEHPNTPGPNMSTLEELDLSYNSLKALGEGFALWFPNLKWLDISHNSMDVFFWGDAFPQRLSFLNASHNNARKSFMHFRRFPLLETIDISYESPNTYFSDIMEYEVIAPRLRKLYASGYDNTTMKDLKLDYLRMKINEDKFPVLVNCSIKTLDLSNGKIRFLSNIGLNKSYAENLDISNNKIRDWDSDTIFANKDGSIWTKSVNLSFNAIRFMQPHMLHSLSSLLWVDVGGNPYECNNCSIQPFQTWLHDHPEIVSVPPTCGSPPEMRGVLVTTSDFYDEFCIPASPLLGGLVGGFLVIAFMLAQCVLLYRYRHRIVFIQHLYKLRVKKPQEDEAAATVVGSCTHDVFICYSSADRTFVLQTLAPLIEEGPERYKAYIHERSFTLGSDINDNIVEAIERSRRALLVISQAFLGSQYCKKEMDMVTHRAFEGTAGYMVLLRYGSLRPEAVPRPLRLYMSTKTYLEWPDDPSQLDRMEGS